MKAVDEMGERERRWRRKAGGLGMAFEHPVGRAGGEDPAAGGAEHLVDDLPARPDGFETDDAVLFW